VLAPWRDLSRTPALGRDDEDLPGAVAMAAAAIRGFSDEELDRAASVSLNADAPLTCQFMLEDHAVRHSYHHLAAIRTALVAVGRAA
jgi:hypothetical protein